MKYYSIEFDYHGDIVLRANSEEEAMEKFFALTVTTINSSFPSASTQGSANSFVPVMRTSSPLERRKSVSFSR